MKNRLKVLRAERNWSQADLAELLEASRQLAGIPHLPLYAVFPIFCGVMGLSQVLIRLRYQ